MAAPVEKSRLDTRRAVSLSRSIGFAAALVSTVFGFLYLPGLAGNLITTGSVYPATSRLQVISAIIAILWDQVLVVLFVALRRRVPDPKKIFAELALVFIVLLCAVSSVSWFVQLAIVPKVDSAGNAALLAWIDPHNPQSLPFAMEHLGWGLFFGLAAWFAALAIQGGRLETWVRWLLFAAGLLSLLHLAGLVVSNPVLAFLGYPAWGILLPLATLLLAVRFKSHKLGQNWSQKMSNPAFLLRR